MNASIFDTKSNIHSLVVTAVSMVLLWRVAALIWSSSIIDIPDGLHLLIAFLGLLFLACGVVAWWISPGRWTGIFLLYGIGGGIHWGGSIGFQLMGVELSFLFIYLTLSILAEGAFLHLALIFPSGRSISRLWLKVIYAPTAFALIMVPIAGFVSMENLNIFIGVLLTTANLLGIFAGILFIVSLIRSDASIRRSAHLPLVVSSLIVAQGITILAEQGFLPGHAETWNLAYGLIPICLTYALVSPARKALKEVTAIESNSI